MKSIHKHAETWLSRLRTLSYSLHLRLRGDQFVALLAVAVLLPIYLFHGHFFLLIDEVTALFRDPAAPPVRLFVLAAGTLLILYGLFLLVTLFRPRAQPVDSPTPLRHPCLVIKQVPPHLYKAEVKPELFDANDLVGAHTTLDPKSRERLEELPRAMDILRDNTSLLDIYAQVHPAAGESPAPADGTRSLFEILRDHEHPEINTESDLHQLIDNPKPPMP